MNDLPPAMRAQVEAATGGKAAKKAPKYRNRRVEFDGKRFDSQLEADYYAHLCLLVRAGVVRWFVRQVDFDLPGGIVYRADFLAVWAVELPGVRGNFSRTMVIDPKGVLTADCRNKLKLMEATHDIVVQVPKRVGRLNWELRAWR